MAALVASQKEAIKTSRQLTLVTHGHRQGPCVLKPGQGFLGIGLCNLADVASFIVYGKQNQAVGVVAPFCMNKLNDRANIRSACGREPISGYGGVG